MSKFREYISRIRGSKDGKVLIANFGYLTLLQIASYLFPLITMPYLARVIGAEGFGKIAFASAIIMWVQTVTDWGFNYTATRDVARNREDLNYVSRTFSKVLWARCILALFSLVGLLLLVAIVPKFHENRLIILLTFLLVPGHILYPDWFFQAMEKMKYITIFGVLIRVIFTLFVFVVIHKADDYIYQPLLVSVGYICSGAIALYFIFVKWKIRLHYVPLKQIFSAIKGSTNVFLNNLMPNLYNSFSVVLLGMFGTTVETGIYDVGKKLTTLAHTAMSVVSRVFFPFLNRRIDKHKFYCHISLSIAGVITLTLFLTAQWLIPWFFGAEFVKSVEVLRITSVAIFFVCMSEVYGTNYLIVQGKDKLMRNITFISSIIGFIIAFPLIYYFKHIGAAWVFTLSSLLSGILCYIHAKKIRNHNYE